MKKTNKIFAVFLTLMIALTGLVKTVSVEAKNNSYYSTINQNIRTSATDMASPVIYLPEGKKVEYIEKANNNWFKVKYDGKVGFVDRGDLTSENNYLNPDPSMHVVDTIEEENADTHYVAPTDVNLRSRNVRNGSSLALVERGKKVTYHGTTDNGWFLVESEGKKGYIHRSDLTSATKFEEGNRKFQDVKIRKEKKFNKLEVTIDQSLRTKDSKNYASIVSVPRLSEVKYIGTTENNWFLVEYQDTKGYIYRGDVTAIKEAELPETPEERPEELPEEKPEEKPDMDDIPVSESNGLEYRATSDLNLRAGISTSYEIKAVIKNGATVKHLGTAENGWYKVDYNGIIGFASNHYLKEKSQDKKPILKYKTTANLNMRKGNSTKYSVITSIPKGKTVKHLAMTSTGWNKVEYNGKVGYVSNLYLKTIESYPKLEKPRVFMDYGHGGLDNGASGIGGRREKNDVLKLGLLVTKNLRNNGVIVDEFRNSDVKGNPDLWDRTAMANKKSYNYFVSIHRNAFNGKAHGTETYTHKESSKEAKALSSRIQNNLVNVGFYNRKAQHARFHVLRNSIAPAVLVEAGFIDNKGDNEIFDNKFDEVAKAISDGILSELKRNK